MNFDKQLESILNQAPEDGEDTGEEVTLQTMDSMLPIVFEGKTSELTLSDPDQQEDYNFARANLYGLIGRSNAAIELALKIALMSEHPRALEVASGLMKTSTEMTKELAKLQSTMQGKTGGSGKQLPVTNTQNNYYGENHPQNDQNQIKDDLDDLPDN